MSVEPCPEPLVRPTEADLRYRRWFIVHQDGDCEHALVYLGHLAHVSRAPTSPKLHRGWQFLRVPLGTGGYDHALYSPEEDGIEKILRRTHYPKRA